MKKNYQQQNRPTKQIKLSHHDRSPGAWILRDELSLFGKKKKNHPTLAQYDGERE